MLFCGYTRNDRNVNKLVLVQLLIKEKVVLLFIGRSIRDNKRHALEMEWIILEYIIKELFFLRLVKLKLVKMVRMLHEAMVNL